MALDPKVKAIIEILLADKGTRAAVIGMAKAKGGADALTGSLKKTEAQSKGADLSLGRLGSSLQRWFGVAVLGAFAKSSLDAFATVERGINALTIQMDGLGLSAATNMPRVLAALKTIEDSGDGLLRDTIPAFQAFLGLTKNVDAALFATKLASGIAESGLMDLGGASEVLAGLLSGKTVRSLKMLGVNIQEAADGSVNGAEALKILSDRFLTLGDRLNDTRDQLDKMEASLERAKRAAGGFFGFLAKSAAFVADKPQGFMRMLRAGFGLDNPEEAKEAGEEVGKNLGEGFQEGRDEALRIAAQAERERLAKEADERAKKILEMERKAEDALLAQHIAFAKEGSQARLLFELEALHRMRDQALEEAKDSESAQFAIRTKFRLAEQLAVRDHQEKIAEERTKALEKESEELKKLAEERQKFADEAGEDAAAIRDRQLDAERALLEAMIDLEREGSRRKLDLQIQALEEEQARRLEQEKLTSEAEMAIRQTFLVQREKMERDFAEAEKQLAFQAAMEKSEFAQQVASSSLAAGMAIFGQNKALMIAQAIVDTWAAANRAIAIYGPTPQGYALAALAVVTGFANVVKMQSVQPGSSAGGVSRGGFGGGAGGRAQQGAARGRFTGEFEGRSGGGGGGGGSTTSIDNRSSTTVNINGPVLGGPIGERRLARIVEKARRRDRSRFTR